MLSSHENEIYPTTSVDDNSIEFEFQTDRNIYVDLRQTHLAPKTILFEGRAFDTCETAEKKKEHKEDKVFIERGDDGVELFEEETEEVPHIIHMTKI